MRHDPGVLTGIRASKDVIAAALPKALKDHIEHATSRSSSALSDFAEIFQQIVRILPEQIALLDDHWDVLVTNDAWANFAVQQDTPELLVGGSYSKYCRTKARRGDAPAIAAANGIAEIEAGAKDSFCFAYQGQAEWAGSIFEVSVNRIEIAGRTFATVARHDVTELVGLRRLREGFSRSLIEGQAEERKRVAREIHDSTMQLLTGVSLTLGRLKRPHRAKETVNLIAEMEELLGEAQKELRSISYLAHPPLLEELGLAKSIEALVEGFGRRTGLSITLQIDSALGRASGVAEVAIYRFVQEALSNVHRHAHASLATVILTVRRMMMHAVVVDNGIGMPKAARNGVGIPGMRDRLAELGGRLLVRSTSQGAKLIASLPLKVRTKAFDKLSMCA